MTLSIDAKLNICIVLLLCIILAYIGSKNFKFEFFVPSSTASKPIVKKNK